MIQRCDFHTQDMTETPTKTQTIRDMLDPARALALHQTLGRDGPVPQELPPFWHQIYFWDAQPPVMLGQDCHPKTGIGVIPDLGLPQRMWAGGRLKFHKPLVLGRAAVKTTTLDKVAVKEGRSGQLGFVTLRHEITQDGPCVTEYQDLVYRHPPKAQATAPQARRDEAVAETVNFDTTLLFRYSALTFNGHRIHYDADYARDVEGYAGLVVHGPLLAHLLMDLAERHIGTLRWFEFRATSALMDFETATLCWNAGDLWVRGPDGRQSMVARAG